MDAHEHKYTEPKMYTINKVQPKYPGDPGDKAFLVRKCETCPRVKAFDYGLTTDMKAKFKELEAASGEESNSRTGLQGL